MVRLPLLPSLKIDVAMSLAFAYKQEQRGPVPLARGSVKTLCSCSALVTLGAFVDVLYP